MRQVFTMLVVSAIAACGSGSGSTDTEFTYATEPREVTIASPGAEPRQTVAYAMNGPRASARISLETGTARDGEIDDDGLGFTAKLEWSRTTSDAGRAIYSFRARDVVSNRRLDMSEDERKVVETIDKALASVVGQARVTRSGDLELVQLAGMSTLPSWLGILHEVIVPLPSSPVGVGARWHTKQQLTADGSTVIDERDYEVLEIDGDTLRVLVVGRATTKGNPKAEMAIDTRGEAVIDLADPLPRSATLLSKQHLKFADVPDDDGTPHLVRLTLEH
ncbi:MAG TPA: hypothetical protein VM513_22520 [Kofleriaceae bacterium]|jgi:hypothetical protein|nr:hypothetical protein [Kofleriaceae bacterium]